jgi:leucyl-tRNA synthetase
VVAEDGGISPALRAGPADDVAERLLHRTIKKVTEGIEELRFNTAIAQMMVLVNELTPRHIRPRGVVERLVLILSPFAPHLGEELWQRLGHAGTLAYEPWPAFDPALTVEEQVTIAVQVNGKLRGTVQLPLGASQEDAQSAALAEPSVKRHLDGYVVRKVIFVPNKLLNLVVANER